MKLSKYRKEILSSFGHLLPLTEFSIFVRGIWLSKSYYAKNEGFEQALSTYTSMKTKMCLTKKKSVRTVMIAIISGKFL